MKKQKMTKEQKAEYKQTNEYKYKKYNRLTVLSICEQYIAILSPFCIMLGTYWNQWIQSSDDKYSISIGLILALVMTGIAIYKKLKNDTSFTYLFMIVGWWCATLCFMFLKNVMDDIVEIMIYTGLGLMVSLIGKYGQAYYSDLREEYRDKENETQNKSIRKMKAFKKMLGSTKIKQEEKKADKSYE